MNDKKNRYRTAVGLDYDKDGDQAPTVGVKGERLIADEIVKIARRYNIPVIEDPDVARALKNVEVDEEIPEHLFQAVAIILHRVEERLKD